MTPRHGREPALNDRGFTLVELLVVMIIIGILAAIALPVFLNQRRSAVDASIKADVRVVAILAESIYAQTAAYPDDVTLAEGSTTFHGETLTVSPGNTLAYARIGTDGFCIGGTNPEGNAAAGSTTDFITYNSKTGGLGGLDCP